MSRLQDVALGVAAGAVLVLAASCSTSVESSPAAAASASAAPAAQARPSQSFSVAPDLPLVPGNIATAVRPAEVVKAAYLFAAQHPEVLKYVPCFCGCERGGHRGNDDCFVSARDAAGKASAWEAHGMVCEVCIDVATQARQMHNSGASLVAIREAIEKRYAGSHSHTPTPMPPKKGTHD
jgi:hypothetical protein